MLFITHFFISLPTALPQQNLSEVHFTRVCRSRLHRPGSVAWQADMTHGKPTVPCDHAGVQISKSKDCIFLELVREVGPEVSGRRVQLGP